MKKILSITTCIIMAVTAAFAFPVASGTGDVFASSASMKIYGIYMKRADGSVVASDRYGDAILIESGGRYLLIDAGAECPVKNSAAIYRSDLVSTLKKIGVSRLDVYISHLHGDHQGGLKDVCDNFSVDTLYLPDLNLCRNYVTPNAGKTINAIYYEQIEKARNGLNGSETKIVNLVPNVSGKTGSYNYTGDLNKAGLKNYEEYIYDAAAAAKKTSFTVGSVSAKVLGPVGTYSVSQFAAQDGKSGTKEGHYLNNCSLTTMFTCGGTKFLACGDIEYQEEAKLAVRYGTSLGADIMKVSHHGLSTSSTDTFLSKVKPTWSFNCNNGYGTNYTGRNAHRKYGYYYGLENSKRSIIYTADKGVVRIYKDVNCNGRPDERPLTGWVSVEGRYQYYSGSGVLQRGWTYLKGKNYYMNTKSGFRLTGTHKISGTSCKFNSYGVLTSPVKPSKAKVTDIRNNKGRAAKTGGTKRAEQADTKYTEQIQKTERTRKSPLLRGRQDHIQTRSLLRASVTITK